MNFPHFFHAFLTSNERLQHEGKATLLYHGQAVYACALGRLGWAWLCRKLSLCCTAEMGWQQKDTQAEVCEGCESTGNRRRIGMTCNRRGIRNYAGSSIAAAKLPMTAASLLRLGHHSGRGNAPRQNSQRLDAGIEQDQLHACAGLNWQSGRGEPRVQYGTSARSRGGGREVQGRR